MYNYEYITGEYIYGDDRYIPDIYMDEKWWYIRGVPGYMISDHGRVWSEKSQQFIKPKPMDCQGHLGVCLRVDGRAVYKYIHRLMADAFIPNPNHYPIVRHLNDDRDDISLDNLAWGTQKDNVNDCFMNGHAHIITLSEREMGLAKIRKPIWATNRYTGERTLFASQAEASRYLGIQQSNIWKVLNGDRGHAGDYWFEYAKGGDKYEYQ